MDWRIPGPAARRESQTLSSLALDFTLNLQPQWLLRGRITVVGKILQDESDPQTHTGGVCQVGGDRLVRLDTERLEQSSYVFTARLVHSATFYVRSREMEPRRTG